MSVFTAYSCRDFRLDVTEEAGDRHAENLSRSADEVDGDGQAVIQALGDEGLVHAEAHGKFPLRHEASRHLGPDGTGYRLA
jgi:hypothetical protein